MWKDISFPESIGALIETPAFLGEYTGLKNLRILADIKGGTSDEQIRDAITKVGLDPDVIILDEPINAIDEKGVKLVEEILDGLKKEGKIILIACHDKEELELLADEIFYMEEGKIIVKEEGAA